MSNIAIQGAATGTGVFTLASPATNTDRTLTLPDEAGTVLVNGTTSNVGIGTSSPAYRLDVSATGFIAARISTSYSGTGNIRIEDATTTANAPYIGSVGDNLAFGRIGVAEHMRLDTSGNLKFNSGYGSVATAYGCRAWVNFNGTGTVAIRASGNVSSITDTGGGNYRMNFTTGMPDVNYAVCASTAVDKIITSTISSSTTSYADIRTTSLSGTYTDVSSNYVAIFR